MCGRVLLEEALASSVGYRERPAFQVRDEHGRDRAVVREQVALRDPLDREERLVEVRELEHALPAAQLGRHRLLDANLLRFLVVAQSLVRRRAQAVVVRALDELDLRDQLGLDRRCRPSTRGGFGTGSGRRARLQRAEQAQEALGLLLGEPGADAADVPGLPARRTRRAEATRTCSRAGPSCTRRRRTLRCRAS